MQKTGRSSASALSSLGCWWRARCSPVVLTERPPAVGLLLVCILKNAADEVRACGDRWQIRFPLYVLYTIKSWIIFAPRCSLGLLQPFACGTLVFPPVLSFKVACVCFSQLLCVGEHQHKPCLIALDAQWVEIPRARPACMAAQRRHLPHQPLRCHQKHICPSPLQPRRAPVDHHYMCEGSPLSLSASPLSHSK